MSTTFNRIGRVSSLVLICILIGGLAGCMHDHDDMHHDDVHHHDDMHHDDMDHPDMR